MNEYVFELNQTLNSLPISPLINWCAMSVDPDRQLELIKSWFDSQVFSEVWAYKEGPEPDVTREFVAKPLLIQNI